MNQENTSLLIKISADLVSNTQATVSIEDHLKQLNSKSELVNFIMKII